MMQTTSRGRQMLWVYKSTLSTKVVGANYARHFSTSTMTMEGNQLVLRPFDLQKEDRKWDVIQYKKQKKKKFPTLSDEIELQPITSEVSTTYKNAKSLSVRATDMFDVVHRPTHLDFFPKGDPDWMKLTEAILAPAELELELKKKVLMTLEITENEFFSRLKHPDRSIRRIDDWNLLLRAQTAQNRLDLAQQTFQKLQESNNPEIHPNVVTYTAIIHACALLGGENAHVMAFDYFRDMKLRDIEPTIATYGTLIHAFTKAGKVNEAFELMEVMRARDIQPNIVIHSTVLAACVKNGDLTRAWQHYELMNSKYSIQPDEVSLTIMINAATQAGQTEKAINLFKQFDQLMLSPTTITYHSVMMACCKRKDHRWRVFQYADMMELHGHKPTTFTFNILSYACAKDGKVDKIPQLLEKMRAMNVKADEYTYNTLLAAYRVANMNHPPKTHNQHITDAMTIFNLMPLEAIPVTIVTLNAALGVLASALRIQRAFEFFEKEYASYGIEHDEITYTTMITMLVRANRVEVAEQMFHQFKKKYPNLKPTYSMYKHLVFGYTTAGQDQKAAQWLYEMFTVDGYKLNPMHLVEFTSKKNGADNVRRRNREKLVNVKEDMDQLLKVF